MTLTTHQLNTLRYDLVSLATIKYDDVMAELLDHYASLTEQKMANGLAFDEASKWAWAELGSGAGLQKIQDDYVKSIERQVHQKRADIVGSYFRWPALVTTALIVALVYMVVPLLPAMVITVTVWVMIVIPATLMMWAHRIVKRHPTSSRFIVYDYLKRGGAIFINLAQVGMSFSGGWFGYSDQQSFVQTHPIFSILICLLLLLYDASFIQLFRYQFHHKIAL